MVRSEAASAGVMFTLDTESGFQDVVFVTLAWGFGETAAGRTVNIDELYVFKPTPREGAEAVVSKTIGSKLAKIVYAKAAATRPSVPPPRGVLAAFGVAPGSVSERRAIGDQFLGTCNSQ
ncbi:unnamed protein product, partial [Prorocentrum cordatum]